MRHRKREGNRKQASRETGARRIAVDLVTEGCVVGDNEEESLKKEQANREWVLDRAETTYG